MYETFFNQVLFPAYETRLRGRRTLEYVAEYEKTQWLSREEIYAIRLRKLQQLLAFCEEHVPYYKRLFKQEGFAWQDVTQADDMAALPLLTKDIIRENREDLIAIPYRGKTLTKATGGSTGDPLHLDYTRESYERRIAVMTRGYGWAGAINGRKTLYLWGVALGQQGVLSKWKTAAFHAAYRHKILNSFAMDAETVEKYARIHNRYKARVIVAYVSPLVTLAAYFKEQGKVAHSPESILVAAEPLHPHQRALLEEVFGCPVFNTYGCREFMLIGAECREHNGLHMSSDHLLIETVDDAGQPVHGTSGNVVISDLHNYGMPFLRYTQGDRATISEDLCACGRGLPLMRSVDGRKLDAIRTVDGKILPGEFFPHLLKDVPGLVGFQVIQETLETLRILLKPGQGFKDSSMAPFEAIIRENLGTNIQITYEKVAELPLTKSGKQRVTISKIEAPNPGS